MSHHKNEAWHHHQLHDYFFVNQMCELFMHAACSTRQAPHGEGKHEQKRHQRRVKFSIESIHVIRKIVSLMFKHNVPHQRRLRLRALLTIKFNDNTRTTYANVSWHAHYRHSSRYTIIDRLLRKQRRCLLRKRYTLSTERQQLRYSKLMLQISTALLLWSF